jgi:hypothetical protein
VNCCGEYYETVEGEQTPVRHRGLIFKFPFDTQKQPYLWWDTTLLEAVPVEYDGVQDVAGLNTYRFVQTIEPSVVGTAEVPPELVGASGTEPVTADRVYSNERTLWVEPHTGVVIDRAEEQLSTLRYEGRDVVTTTAVDTSYSDETVASRIDEYGPLASQLNLVRNIVPLVGLAAGLVLLVVGLALTLTARRSSELGGPRGAVATPARAA